MALRGAREFKAYLRNLPRVTEQQAAAALRAEAEDIMLKSKRDHVPVDQGTLRASGQVAEPVIRGSMVSVELGYGGAASAYALAVHEHPSEHSPPSWSGGVKFTVGGPKYLEKPVLAAARNLGQRIARRLNFGRGIGIFR